MGRREWERWRKESTGIGSSAAAGYDEEGFVAVYPRSSSILDRVFAGSEVECRFLFIVFFRCLAFALQSLAVFPSDASSRRLSLPSLRSE